MKTIICTVALTILLSIGLFAQGSYKQPPKAVQEVLDAPAIPSASVSPTRDKIALFEPLRYPPISELAEPMLRLAGSRINPRTNGQHRQGYSVSLTLKNISDGKETPVLFPPGAKIISPSWSPDGKSSPPEMLWQTESNFGSLYGNGKSDKDQECSYQHAYGGFDWEDSKTISATLVPPKRRPAPAYQDITPNEPNIQETSGRSGQIATFQDLLKSPNDEKLFDYYATSQLALIDVTGKVREIGQPAIFDNASFSPDGKYILASRIQRPYSYLFPSFRFPKKVEIWDSSGKLVQAFADIPLQDSLPSQGVPVGRRSYQWIPTEASTLVGRSARWRRSTKEGGPSRQIDDGCGSVCTEPGTELVKIQQRYQGSFFGERDAMMMFSITPRHTRRRLFMIDYRKPSNPKLVSDLNVTTVTRDRTPIMKTLPNARTWFGRPVTIFSDRCRSFT